ncbi:MAG TPA: hypothetical protein VF427_15645 [Noviherbaspirillum sp.]
MVSDQGVQNIQMTNSMAVYALGGLLAIEFALNLLVKKPTAAMLPRNSTVPIYIRGASG